MTENGIYGKTPLTYVRRLLKIGQTKKALACCFYSSLRGEFSFEELMPIFDVKSKSTVSLWVKEFDEEIAKMEASHYFHNEQKTASIKHAQKSIEQKSNDNRTKIEQANTDINEFGDNTIEQKSNDNRTKIEHTNNKEKYKGKGKTTFTPPTPQEIAEFIKSRQIENVSVDDFYLHYMSNGWKVGKVPMVSWKHTVLKWSRDADKRRAA